MAGWVFWVILACAFGVGEMLSGGFFLAPFALGAGLAAAGAAVAGETGAVIVFIVASIMSLVVLRPIVRSHTKMPPAIRTGGAALIGKRAIVLERIANDEASGCARIEGGQVWTARAFDGDRVIEPGERVMVMEIRGATAVVD